VFFSILASFAIILILKSSSNSNSRSLSLEMTLESAMKRRHAMKQALSSIGILILLILFSISDFKFPDSSQTVTDWDASQYDPDPRENDYHGYGVINLDLARHECIDHQLSDQVMEGSDGACVAASMEMLTMMDRYQVDCLFITNKGWIPATLNPVTRHWVNWSLSNDAPY
jgi:hypothetical protein